MTKKHPFQKFYDNNLTLDVLPEYTKSMRLIRFIERKVHFVTRSQLTDIWLFYPVADTETTEYVWVFPNFDARMKGEKGRAKMKFGKVIRAIFPDMADSSVELLVNLFKDEFGPVEPEFFKSDKPGVFEQVYTGDRFSDRMFETSSLYKRMSDSCMRYETEHFDTPHHPVEAFASGDFEMWWTEVNGKIASRMIYCKVTNTCGPIYSTCKEAIEVLDKERGEIDAKFGGFVGAKLLNLSDDDRIFGPYFDFEPTRVKVQGEYLINTNRGDIDHGRTGFYSTCHCSQCGDSCPLDDMVYVESVDGDVCDTCRHHDFFVSDLDSEYYPDGDSVEVYASRSGNLVEWWTQYQADECAKVCAEDGYYWTSDLVEETHDGGKVSLKHIDSGNWFICSIDELAWPIRYMVETYEYGVVSVDNIDLDEYEQGRDGLYYKKEEEEDAA